MKRFIDILLSILLFPIVILTLLVLSIVLFVELKEIPFFIQERGITLTRFRFKIFKLKTIRTKDADESNSQENENILINPKLLPKLSKFTSWLRRTGLDELPQIFNILIGNMSFIGPRPLMLSDLQRMKREYPHFYRMRQQLNSKPGLSGLWQIFCNRDEGVKNLIALDSLYEEMKSPKLDIKLFIFTIPVVLTGSNADSILTNGIFPIKNLLSFKNATHVLFLTDPQPAEKNEGIKSSEDYQLTIPGNWWSKNTSYSPLFRDKFKIIPLNKNTGNIA